MMFFESQFYGKEENGEVGDDTYQKFNCVFNMLTSRGCYDNIDWMICLGAMLANRNSTVFCSKNV